MNAMLLHRFKMQGKMDRNRNATYESSNIGVNMYICRNMRIYNKKKVKETKAHQISLPKMKVKTFKCCFYLSSTAAKNLVLK